MADIPFSIDGHTILCPSSTNYEPGGLIYQYQNGSQVMIGAPQVTYTWAFLPDNYVTLIWATFDTLLTGGDLTAVLGNPVNVTVPDFFNGGFRATTAYMTRPTGKAVGDGTQDFSVTFYNLHAVSMELAINSPTGNYWEMINNGLTIIVGASEYPGTGWQY
jgi:hypothetical protein